MFSGLAMWKTSLMGHVFQKISVVTLLQSCMNL